MSPVEVYHIFPYRSITVRGKICESCNRVCMCLQKSCMKYHH